MPTRTPEDLFAQLRAMRDEIEELHPLSAQERRDLRNQTITSDEVLHASFNVINMHPGVERSVGHSLQDVRALESEFHRWLQVERELYALFSGVAGANLIRRQRISFIAMQAYLVAERLARDPAYNDLVTQVEEIRRLRRLARGRRTRKSED